eukprot:CAMPEP_0172585946 /NCGR_PEP_ID=MMETSP1068-20121228/5333_1 /TAXON_ID=35684 /ORGANISM="Pseudopedinella elastica, Strain CCMP716" /LENGTH=116 /DNA_ID=CAMNT_0013380583 /DNA_START=379 /DNA_END=734 /DNA_ORIENTATION=+
MTRQFIVLRLLELAGLGAQPRLFELGQELRVLHLQDPAAHLQLLALAVLPLEGLLHLLELESADAESEAIGSRNAAAPARNLQLAVLSAFRSLFNSSNSVWVSCERNMAPLVLSVT